MMDALFSLLKNLAAVVMLVTICDLLMPEGAMRRYARLAGGLMTMLMIISTLLGWLPGVKG